MKLVRGLTAVTAVVLAGCAQDPGAVQIRAAGEVSQEIQGGTFDSTSSNVVAILIGAGQGGICSGSLIAPNLVLTAHHCVADTFTTACGSNGFGTPFAANSFRVTMSGTAAEAVFNGTAQWPSVDNVNWFTANLVALPTTPANNICGGDMALLRLSANITSVCPLIPRVDSPVALNEAYTAVGFGVTSPTGQTAGRRYTVSGLNVLCEANCGQGTAASEWIGGTSAARGVCEGDSGGPALDALRRVVGTVSRGDANSCNQALYESVFAQAAWIKGVAATAASVGGYTAPAWVTGGSTSVNPCTGMDGGTGGGAGGGGGGVTGGGAGGGGGSTGTCNSGTTCVDASGAGNFACLDSAGNVPASAPPCSQTVACALGFSCWQTGTSTFACLQDCGGAPPLGGGAGGGVPTGGGAGGGVGGGGGAGGTCTNPVTTCVDASGMGNYACVDLNSSTGIPAGAASCSATAPCAANSNCWGTPNGNFCLENCTPGATGGGAGGGGPAGGGAGGGVPAGGGAGGGTPVGGGAGGGTPVGGGAGGGTPVGGGTGGGTFTGGGSGGGTGLDGGTGTGGSGGFGGSGGAGGGFMFPGLPEQPKKTGCSCNEVPSGAIWLALSGLTLIRRRRRG